ncbi:MAG: COX15/CtaA family protein [Candidatus Methylomirabilales bacterium]
MPGPPPAGSAWPHRLAMLSAAATCLLILVGGLVTHTGSGLAVPDWPTTFGHNMFLYPLSRMAGGVLYEHSHRLLGSLVGLLTVATAAAICLADRRAWLRTLAILAVGLVMVQGVLGGLRVTLLAQGLAMLHGAVAPAFLALLASLALFTSPAWQAGGGPAGQGLRPLRWLGLAATAALYLQIGFGVVLTHTGRRLDAHLLVAGGVSVLVPLLVRGALRGAPGPLGRPARLLCGLWVAQLLLGGLAYVARFHAAEVPVAPLLGLGAPLAHRLAGALMLAAAAILTLQIHRLSATSAAAPAGRRVPA